MNETKVSVVGLGYVGLPLALLASKKKFQFTGIDLDNAEVRAFVDGKNSFDKNQFTLNKIVYKGVGT